MSTTTLLVDIKTNVAEFTKDMKKMSSEVVEMSNKVTGTIKGIQGAFAVLGTGALATGLFAKATSEAADAEKSFKQLQQVIRSTGGAAGVSANSIAQLTAELQKTTGVSDDALNSATAMLLTFTKIGKQVMPDAVRAISDLSTAMHGDLQGAAIQVGKAMNDPVKGITALTRVGVNFTETQKGLIKQLTETGRIMDAQKLILRELQTEFGGSAAAARDTFGGALEALKITVGDLFETIGTSSNGGLRGGIELLITSVEHANKSFGEFDDWLKSSDKDAQKLRDTLKGTKKNTDDFWTYFRIGANKGLSDLNQIGKKINQVNDAGLLGPKVPDWRSEEELTRLANIPKYAKTLDGAMEMAGAGFVQKFTTPIRTEMESIVKETNDRTKQISEAAAKAKTRMPTDLPAPEDKEADKAYKKSLAQYESEMKAINDIVEASAKHGAELVAQTEQQKERLRLEEMLAKIEEQKVGELDKEVARRRVTAQWERDQAQIKANHLSEEKTKLEELLAEMKVNTAEITGQATGHEEIAERMKLELELSKLTKVSGDEYLGIVKQIREEKEKQIKAEQDRKHDEELKSVREILDGYKEQQLAIQAKANGYEDYLPLLRDERKIMEDMKNLTPEEKKSKVQELRDSYAVTQQYNQQLKSQEELVKKVTSGSTGYYNQTRDLKELLTQNRITVFQYNEAMKQLQSGTKGASDTGKEFADVMGKGIEDMVFGTKKLSEGLKDVGKELAKLAIKKAFIDPLKEKLGYTFDAVGRNLFGLGKTPGIAGSGIAPSSTPPLSIPSLPGVAPGINSGLPIPLLSPAVPALGQNTAPIYSYGPVTLFGGSVALNNPQLSAGGSSTASGGLGTILGGSMPGGVGGGWLGNLLSPIEKLSRGIGGFLGNLFNSDQKSENSWNKLYQQARSADAFPEFGGFRLTGGGMSKDVPYAVGEGGMELVIPGSNSTVVSNPQIRAALGQALGARAQSGFTASSRPSIDAWLQSVNPFAMPTGTVWTPEQQAFFGDNPYISAQNDANKYRDLLASTQRTAGTPLYQLTPGFAPNFPPEVQSFLDKLRAYNALSPDEQRMARTNGSAPRNDEWAPVMAFYNQIPLGIEGKLRDLMRSQDVAFAESALSQTTFGPSNTQMWASDILNNHTALDRYAGKVALPDGNQLARLLTSWEHRTGAIDPEVLAWANTRDALADIIHPGGNWQAMQFQSGTREGSGMAGQGSGMFQGVDIVDTAPVRGGWGERGSGLESFARPTIWGTPGSASNDPFGGWGSGLGYMMGWHKPVDGNNSSLLNKPGITSGAQGLLGMLAQLFGLGGMGASAASLQKMLPAPGGNGIREYSPTYVPGETAPTDPAQRAVWLESRKSAINDTSFGPFSAAGQSVPFIGIGPNGKPMMMGGSGSGTTSGGVTLADGTKLDSMFDPRGRMTGGTSFNEMLAGDSPDYIGFNPESKVQAEAQAEAMRGLAAWQSGNTNTEWGQAHFNWGARPATGVADYVPESGATSGNSAYLGEYGFKPIGSGKTGEATMKQYDALNRAAAAAYGDWSRFHVSDFVMNALGGWDYPDLTPDSLPVWSGPGTPFPGIPWSNIQDLGQTFGGMSSPFMQNFGGTALGGLASGGAQATNDWSWAKPFLEATKLGGRIFSPITDVASEVWNSATSFYGSKLGQYAPGADLYGSISSTATNLYNSSPSWLKPGWEAAGSLFDFGGGRKTGGHIEGMNFYETGESGREFVFAGARGQVVSNAAAESALERAHTKSGGGDINIQIINKTSNTHGVSVVKDAANQAVKIVFDELKKAMPAPVPGAMIRRYAK